MSTSTIAMPAKEILVQAHDTLRASFWVKGEESFTDWWKPEDGVAVGTFDVTDKKFAKKVAKDLGHEKVIVLPPYSQQSDGLHVVTGVCSIGAMALAYAVRTMTQLESFDTLVREDFEHYKAALALSRVIVETPSQWHGQEITWVASAGGTIANWNDNEDLTKAQLLSSFKKAINMDFLEAKVVWLVKIAGRIAGTRHMPTAFRTKTEAQAWVKMLESGTTEVSRSYLEDFGSGQLWEFEKVSALPLD